MLEYLAWVIALTFVYTFLPDDEINVLFESNQAVSPLASMFSIALVLLLTWECCRYIKTADRVPGCEFVHN